jgi:serine/threonine protein kinase
LERWKANEHKFLFERLKAAAVGIARGMEYLHANKVAFRDLKPRNIGFDAATGTVKIFDFGLACEMEENKRGSPVGTIRYMAPEVASGQPYGLSCDVYSFGIILWQICSLRIKFVHKLKTKAAILHYVVIKGGRPSLKSLDSPKNIKKLIEGCWHPDPQCRPSFTNVCELLEDVLSVK